MDPIQTYGIDPHSIDKYMVSALAIDQELSYRLECRDMFEEVKLVHNQALSCYKTLASVCNYIEIERYKNNALHVCDFDVSKFCKGIFSRIQSKMRRSNIEFDFEVEDGLVCRCDPDRLAACLTNLIVNSYACVDNDEGMIKATVRQYSDYAAFTIMDNGCGMTQSEVEKYRNSEGASGLHIMHAFCKSVGTEPITATSELSGLSLSFKIPLSPVDDDLKLKSPIEPFKTGLFMPSEILLYKLDGVIVSL